MVGFENDYYYTGSMFSPEDKSRVRQVLVQFSQDPEVVLALHKGLEMLREERVKMEQAANEKKRQQEVEKKHQEQEEAKKRGKEKVGKSSGVDKDKPPSPLYDQGILPSPVREPEGEVLPTSWKKIAQWRAQHKATIANYVAPDAKQKFKKLRQEDALAFHQQITRDLQLLDLAHRDLPEDRVVLENLVFECSTFTRSMNARLQAAREDVEKEGSLLAIDQDLSDGYLENLAEIEESNTLLRQEKDQLQQQLNNEAEDRVAKALRQIKDLREMNSQMATQLHSAEERAKVLEVNTKAQQ